MESMGKTEQICQLAIEKCIDIFEKVSNLGISEDDRYGKTPKSAQITYFKTIPGKTRLSNKREHIQYWKYENEELKSVNSIKDKSMFVRDGMYYDIASFDFEIKVDSVILIYTMGPRFGRCIEYKIKDENGKVKLDNGEIQWVS